tara:strand:- start:15221 stop:16576 length:1356 start_codon:yes stop_codon:yes gene_type:complete
LKPGRDNGEIIVDTGVRGHGVLVLRVTQTGKPLYYRYFHKGSRYFELIGHFDPKGSRHWRDGDRCFKGAALTLAAARDGFRELAQLAKSVRDLKSHYTAEEARKQGEQRKAEIEARAGTFGDLLTAYVASLQEAGKPSAKDVAGLFKRHVEKPFPQITKRRANTITPEDIQAILARLVDRGVTRGVNITRSYLRAAFSYAGRGHDLDPRRLAQDGKKFALTGNPVDLIPRIASFERVGERVLDADEMRKYVEFICDPAKVPNPITRAALQMHVYTGGQRVRQLLSAPWSAYDRDGGTVTLIDLKGRAEPREHVVPLVPEALAILEVLHEETGTADWPFTTNGKTGLRHETLVKAVAEVRSLEEDGTRAFSTPFTLKDIRRTVETTLASLGVSKEHRAQLLSHGRGDKIAQAYDKHNYLDEKRRALETWLAFLRGSADAGANVVPMRQAQTG